MTAKLHFPLLGEPVSLDLVNTRVRRGGADVDLLETPSALTAWLAAESGRLSWSGAVTAADLRAVRTLRDAIAALLRARRVRARPPSEAMKVVNAALSASVPATRLAWTAKGPRAERRTAGSRRDTLLHTLALDAVTILTGPDATLVRTCAHPDCVLQFLARHPRRRWCSASVCGNRARVARHYVRHRVNA
ncbi:MAG TPA: ABATE domain-containing protein [Gemmatimonadaceae bacterium]|nr:ABATE domain-containing protein [Gemmatimonadaceae bacterium]